MSKSITILIFYIIVML